MEKLFSCPNCGAAAKPDGAEVQVECRFCRSTIIVPKELRTVKKPTFDRSIGTLVMGTADEMKVYDPGYKNWYESGQ